MAREEVARVLIGDGERITIHAVAGAKLALEVRRPQIVRLVRRDRHHAGVAVWPTTRTFVAESAARAQIRHGADGGPVGDAWMSSRQHAQRLPRAPEWVLSTQLTQLLCTRGGDAMRTVMRGATSVLESSPSLLGVPLEPFVPYPAADAVSGVMGGAWSIRPFANLPRRHHLPKYDCTPMLETLLRLPPAERIQLIGDAWESLAASPESVPVPDWHRELLDERLADPTEIGTHTWDEVNARVRRSAS